MEEEGGPPVTPSQSEGEHIFLCPPYILLSLPHPCALPCSLSSSLPPSCPFTLFSFLRSSLSPPVRGEAILSVVVSSSVGLSAGVTSGSGRVRESLRHRHHTRHSLLLLGGQGSRLLHIQTGELLLEYVTIIAHQLLRLLHSDQ